MNIYQQDEKDISKVFTFLHTQLRMKEKELLELQRVDPYLLAPDSDQVVLLTDAIASLQLSTEDGSFVFASAFDGDEVPSCKLPSSVGFDLIKTLPSSVWLSESSTVKQQNQQRPSMFNHLLSLPIEAYLASSWPSLFHRDIKTQNHVFHRIPMVNHLLCMPLNSFKPLSSSTTCTSITIKNHKNLQNNVAAETERTMKSLLNTGTIFSKEFWLQKN